MNLKTTSWRNLTGEARIIARMERIATVNTIHGGASAILISERLLKMGGTDLRHVVSDVYSASTGRAHPAYAAFECPECGCACLGEENALNHCNFDNE